MLLNQTKNIFSEPKQIQTLPWNEGKFIDFTEVYFQLVKKSKEYTEKYLRILYTLKFGENRKNTTQLITTLKDFEIIKDQYPSEDLIVPLNQEIKNLLAEWQQKNREIKEQRNSGNYKAIFPLKSELKRIFQKIQNYMISIPKQKLRPEFKNKTGLHIIPEADLEIYYDKLTGFIRTKEKTNDEEEE